jgi:hypothetical protein
MPIKGSATDGLDAMIAVRTLQVSKLGTVVKAMSANPMHGWLLLKSIAYGIPGLKALLANPHDYSGDMTRAVEFLHQGERAPFMGLHAATTSSHDHSAIDERDWALRRHAAIAALSLARVAV